MSFKINCDSIKTATNIHLTRHQGKLLKPKDWISLRTPRAKCLRMAMSLEVAGTWQGVKQVTWAHGAEPPTCLSQHILTWSYHQSDWSRHSDFNISDEWAWKSRYDFYSSPTVERPPTGHRHQATSELVDKELVHYKPVNDLRLVDKRQGVCPRLRD